jgi:CoA-substrate-specific enzyme activase, putative
VSGWRLGLDLGSTASKAVLMAPNGDIVAMRLDASGTPPAEAARLLASQLVDEFVPAGVSVSHVATGYGRALAGQAGRKVTEITCHARGVRYLHPDAVSILDIGGQDAKAIRMGQGGAVDDFVMNDRCAAGTGRFLEVAARRYGLDVGEVSAFCNHEPGAGGEGESFEISSTCVVFAESELVGLNARGVSPVEAIRAVHRAIARRIALLLSQVGAREPVYFTGGVAHNETLRRALERETGLVIHTATTPQFAGAIGAALFGRET